MPKATRIFLFACALLFAAAGQSHAQGVSPAPLGQAEGIVTHPLLNDLTPRTYAKTSQDEVTVNYYGDPAFFFNMEQDVPATVLRMNATVSGTLQGINFTLFNGNADAPGVQGTGPLQVKVFAGADFADTFPGLDTEALATVEVPFGDLTATEGGELSNPIDLSGEEIAVAAGEEYLIMLSIDGGSGNVALTPLLDNGSTDDANTDYYPARTLIYARGSAVPTGGEEGYYSFTDNSNMIIDFILQEGTGGSQCEGAISIADARETAEEETVTVEGTVTRALGRSLRLQDETAGIATFQGSGDFFDAIANGDIEAGDVLCLTGERSDFNDLQQISPQSWTVIQDNAGLPDPQMVTVDELLDRGEDYESELIQVGGLLIVDTEDATFQGDQSYTVEEPDGDQMILRVQRDTDSEVVGEPVPDGRFMFTGVLGQFRDDYQLIPVRTSDLTADPQTSTGDADVPDAFALHAAYPNPFNPQTTLAFTLPQAGPATLTIYDAQGRAVTTLLARELSAGTHTATWTADALPSGVYFARLQAAGQTQVRTLTLLK